MLDQITTPLIVKACRKTIDQPNCTICCTQQQRASVRGNCATIKRRNNFAPFYLCKTVSSDTLSGKANRSPRSLVVRRTWETSPPAWLGEAVKHRTAGQAGCAGFAGTPSLVMCAIEIRLGNNSI
jgi:hypothetical protein